jgi:DNA-directed RNA polymerase specialized sigma24 family protein
LVTRRYVAEILDTWLMAVDPVRRRHGLERLPLPYSTALRLRDEGLSDELIAKCVGIEPEAVATMLELAEAKLAAAAYLDDPESR